MPAKLEVKKGDIYGRWKVVKEIDRAPCTPRKFLVRCACGSVGVVLLANLRSGISKSCGCLQREIRGNLSRKHGLSGEPWYCSWEAMMARCYNPKDVGYHRYGGRGIKVCRRWHDAALFAEDMAATHVPGLTLERGNVNGDYKPGNVTWATRKRQAYNRRKQSNNTSGVSCVSKGKGVRGSEFWEAKWRTPDGKDISRKFSIAKHGNDRAFGLACKASEEGHKEANYSRLHGK